MSFRRLAMFVCLLVGCCLPPGHSLGAAQSPPAAIQPAATPAPDRWDDQFGEPGGVYNSVVYDLLLAPDGDLYAGGTAGVLRWDGRIWHRLGATEQGGEVRALAALGGSIYAGGRFATIGGQAASNLARWDGAAWQPVGGGVGGTDVSVEALQAHNGALYAGGHFASAGGQPASNLARWDGSAWHSVGGGVLGDNKRGQFCCISYAPVTRLAVHQAQLYVGGAFTQTGSLPLSGLARWDGSQWSSVGGALSGERVLVSALHSAGGTLYVGGTFALPDGTLSAIARWNGSAWTRIAAQSVLAPPQDLLLRGGKLYAVSAQPLPGPMRILMVWDGTTWQRIGPQSLIASSWIYALAQNATTLYVGGVIIQVHDDVRGRHVTGPVLQFRDGDWLALGNGLYAPGRSIAVTGDNVFVNDNDGSMMAWDGQRWTQYQALINALLFGTSSDLYSFALGNANISRWDPPRWTTIGDPDGGLNGAHTDSTDLYVGGSFTSISGMPASGLARWNGSQWFAIPTAPITGLVSKVYTDSGQLYAGFYQTQTRHVVGRWDGAAWTQLGAPFASEVTRLAAHAGQAYVLAGSTIHAWNGSGWTAIGAAWPNAPMAIFDGKLVAPQGAGGLSRWDGAAWQSLDANLSGGLNAIAVAGNDLYLAGDFTSAGGTPSWRIARLNTNRVNLYLPFATR